MAKKKKFLTKVTSFSQVSSNMSKINTREKQLDTLLKEYRRLLTRLKGINFNKVRQNYPAGGGPNEGTAPKPKPWPP